jgi:GT2 family glycosyltransferase
MSEKRCAVAICHNGPVVLTNTAKSLMEIGWGNRVQTAKDAHGFAAIDFMWETGFPRVDAMRDGVLIKALNADYTHVLFLDADMTWPTDTLTRMLAYHDKGIVSGLYCLKSGAFMPVAMKDPYIPEGQTSTTFYKFDLDYRTDGQTDADGLRDVDVVGMGCTLIPLSAVRAMGPRPWFHYENDDDGWPSVSEDVPFCRKAKATGTRVSWAPAIKCEHGAVQFINEQWHVAAVEGPLVALARSVKDKQGEFREKAQPVG